MTWDFSGLLWPPRLLIHGHGTDFGAVMNAVCIQSSFLNYWRRREEQLTSVPLSYSRLLLHCAVCSETSRVDISPLLSETPIPPFRSQACLQSCPSACPNPPCPRDPCNGGLCSTLLPLWKMLHLRFSLFWWIPFFRLKIFPSVAYWLSFFKINYKWVRRS